MIDIASPRPAVNSASDTPTMMTNGSVNARDWPEIQQTRASGNKPIKKLTRPASADEIAKICGGT